MYRIEIGKKQVFKLNEPIEVVDEIAKICFVETIEEKIIKTDSSKDQKSFSVPMTEDWLGSFWIKCLKNVQSLNDSKPIKDIKDIFKDYITYLSTIFNDCWKIAREIEDGKNIVLTTLGKYEYYHYIQQL